MNTKENDFQSSESRPDKPIVDNEFQYQGLSYVKKEWYLKSMSNHWVAYYRCKSYRSEGGCAGLIHLHFSNGANGPPTVEVKKAHTCTGSTKRKAALMEGIFLVSV